MNNSKNYWFAAKTYGYGWTPNTWQGWMVVLVYMIVVIAGTLVSVDEDAITNLPLFLASLIIPTLLLVWISYKKGPKPSWRWGNPDKNQ